MREAKTGEEGRLKGIIRMVLMKIGSYRVKRKLWERLITYMKKCK